MLSLKLFFRSFYYAARGVRVAWKQEQSFRIQILIAAVVIFLIFYLQVVAWQAVALLLLTVFVLVLELLNSTLERMIDVFKPRLHPYVEDIKDIMAATVLVASIGSLIIGLIILWPYLFH